MKILYPVAYFQPENIAFSHLEHDLFQALTEAGHEINVLCPTPTRGISDAVWAEYRHKREETLYGGRVHVRRFWAPREGKNPLIRAFRYFWCNFRQYQLGKRYRQAELILAGSTPPTQGLLSGLLKKKLGCPSVYYLQDIFPDSLIHTGLAKKDSLLWKMGRRVEDYTYRHADKIVVISEDFRRNIMAKGVPADKIELIPNWIDENAVFAVPRAENPLFDQYQIPRDRFYVAYSGNIGHTQNMDMLLDAAKSLMDRPDIGFLIVGDGAYRGEVERRVAEEGISNVTLLPFQPYEAISQVFSLGDVGLLISKSGVGSNSVPSKTWSYFSAERPVLASFDLDSELCRLIEREGTGVCVAPDDAQALRQAILEMAEDKAVLGACGQRARAYILEHLTVKSATDMWLNLLRQIRAL